LNGHLAKVSFFFADKFFSNFFKSNHVKIPNYSNKNMTRGNMEKLSTAFHKPISYRLSCESTRPLKVTFFDTFAAALRIPHIRLPTIPETFVLLSPPLVSVALELAIPSVSVLHLEFITENI
jgi:hypothetical protein